MARRRREEEHENHERWLVSYADFITLLFAFFTVLYATSQHDVKKQEEFEKSIRKYFSGSTGGVGGGIGDFNTESENRNLIESPIAGFPPMSAGPQEVQDYVQRVLKKSMSKEEFQDAIQDIHHDSVGARIQLAASALFPSGSAELKVSSAAALDKIGELLRQSNRRIIIEGHTDNEPVHTLKYPSNWELSAVRATKVLRYLATRDQIDVKRMAAIAYADQKPISINDTEANRAKNRRIEILIVSESK
jgi:chemotaxis protein MotB